VPDSLLGSLPLPSGGPLNEVVDAGSPCMYAWGCSALDRDVLVGKPGQSSSPQCLLLLLLLLLLLCFCSLS
jgi:hypothetical protein